MSQRVQSPQAVNHDRSIAPFRFLPLIYASACIYASVQVVAAGDNSLYKYAHAAFVVAFLILFPFKRFFDGLWRPLARFGSSISIFVFILYFLCMALFYPDTEVSSDQLAQILTRIIPGLMIGYATFGGYADRKAAPYWRPSMPRKSADGLAIIIYLSVIASAYSTLVPMLRGDVFLVHAKPENLTYQIFGIYINIAQICFLAAIEPYTAANNRKRVAAIWTIALCASTAASFFLAQMVGSNGGAVLSVAIGAMLVIYRAFATLRIRRAKGAAFVMVVIATATIWLCWETIQRVPPMRLLGYHEIDLGDG
ncbi:hypothetical protein [Mesorhizobium sp. SP-1A]|uniref:hypothetical protein n=1 Tax=Mesorhizobium sp. SP-1A TaxID=3077840 RepID=UPI0028F71749|nr:hypothetical protein [Mesorhizobium sp. SP-1A]